MRILTWNVNGLRAVLNKGAWDWVEQQAPDVVCLQEIKCRPDQLSASQVGRFQDLNPCWNPAERPGYSGVATFSRLQPEQVHIGLDEPEFDVEGRVARWRFPDFWLFNIYLPSGQRDWGRVEYKLAFYARLLELVDKLHAAGEKVVLCGDFNTAHQEIDLHSPKTNAKTSGFLPQERAWIDTYLSHGLVDAFRSLYPDRIQYTWWTAWGTTRQQNKGWRLDYFLVSEGLMDRVRDVTIHDGVKGSDHCPVEMVIGD